MSDDLFGLSESQKQSANNQSYSAKDIEVLEGLEPVRKRPGMYIGGTDQNALHHLVAEVLDNSMDEAVAGHANRIEIYLEADGYITIKDNGRGIPVDAHPRFPDKSALEVILTTLHSGGKFTQGAYDTAGGLHGVGISVVNALSDSLVVEVARERQLWRQSFSKGKPISKLENKGDVSNRRGTQIRFHPDAEIFGAQANFHPQRLYAMAMSKAYLYKGVEIRWKLDETIKVNQANGDALPHEQIFHFPGGLKDYLNSQYKGQIFITDQFFAGEAKTQDKINGENGRVEWAIAWPLHGGFLKSYCNTIPTPLGGSHESAIKSVLGKGLREYGELIGQKLAKDITGEDVVGDAALMLSVFIQEPQFQGQTKEKLSSPQGGKIVEQLIKDRFDHWLAEDPSNAQKLLDHVLKRMQERLTKRRQKETARASLTRKLPLPGKLADCSQNSNEDTELFLVEGDSAGGSAKQARDRVRQAVLPLKGKILNVASASSDKLQQNQEIKDLVQALGCGMGKDFDLSQLRYQRIIIMTDADVDGAHIAALLMTFFFYAMPQIITDGRLYLACPPLYRLSKGKDIAYASDEEQRDELLNTVFKNKGKVDVSRFKGLGEMMPKQLKETTMNPETRRLIRIKLGHMNHDMDDLSSSYANTSKLIDQLMGKKPEARFRFIQENAHFIKELDI